MQRLAIGRRQRGIGGILDQRMLEGIFGLALARIVEEHFGGLQPCQRRLERCAKADTSASRPAGRAAPITDATCSSVRSSGLILSMRAARTEWIVGGRSSSLIACNSVSFPAGPARRPDCTSWPDDLLEEKRHSFRTRADHVLEPFQPRIVAEQHAGKRASLFDGQRRQPHDIEMAQPVPGRLEPRARGHDKQNAAFGDGPRPVPPAWSGSARPPSDSPRRG